MNAKQVAIALSGSKARKNGGGWTSLCFLHDDNKNSLSLWDTAGGGVNVYCHAGCDPLKIKDELRRRGWLPEWRPERQPRQNLPIQKSIDSAPPEEERPSYPWKKAVRDDQALINIKRYFASRSINLDEVPICFRWGSYLDKKTGGLVNQIVAAVSKPGDTAVYAVHRTLIDTETGERTDKLMLGRCLGRGVWFDRKGPKFILLVGEGIETVLSAMRATGHNGVAALSANGLEALEFPPEANHLMVLADSDGNLVGQKAAVNLARRFAASAPERSAELVTPDDSCFSDHPEKLDFNDLLKADPTGESIRTRFEKAIPIEQLQWQPPANPQETTPQLQRQATQGPINPAEMLSAFEVTQQYVDKIGKEEFLTENLLVRQHIAVIVAMPGGGKTAFFFRHVAPELAKQGLTVWYLDADSPPAEHRAMKELADIHGFKFLNADANIGTSVEGLKMALAQIADAETDLKDWVFIFDTLKKFANLMAKDSVKEFFSMCRKLTARGATIALLAHANKYRSPEGFLVPEGTGDVRSDTDELILFERTKNSDGGIDVTTVVDPDRSAKVRGVFEPFSFHIAPDREITFYKKPLPLVDTSQTAVSRATDDEILNAAVDYLRELAEPVTQLALTNRVCDLTGAGSKRVRELIAQNSERADAEPKKGWRFWYTVGKHNRFSYMLPATECRPEQAALFTESQFGSREFGFDAGE